jgi:hypothetical protein
MSANKGFLLRCWGREAFEVDNLRSPDIIEPVDGALVYWFKTKDEREAFMKEIRSHKDWVVVMSPVDNDHTDQLTYAKVVLAYQGKEYRFSECFGFGYEGESAIYMFSEGNYSCSCNLSMFIKRCCDESFPQFGCGEDIELRSINVVYLDPGVSPDA